MTKPLYFYNGSSFELIGPTTPQSPIAYQTSAPTAPATGDIWIDSDGDVDTYNRQLTRYYFVATASQTTITGTDANGLTLAYVAGSEAVYVNGALQVRGQDYTATNGTSVVMSSGLAVNDVVEIFAYTAFTVANAYTKTETDGIAAAAAGLRMVVPTSVAVGSGTGSVDAIGNVTFSGASSVSLNGCFSSTYDHYKILFEGTISSAAALNWRGRTSGTDNSNSDYSLRTFQINRDATTTVAATNSTTSGRIGNIAATSSKADITIFDPFTSKPTVTVINFINGSGDDFGYPMFVGSFFDVSTSFDGISFIPASGTITGTIRVYGFKD